LFSLLDSLSSCPCSKTSSISVLPLTQHIHMQQHAHLQFTTFTSSHFYTAVNKTEHSEAVIMSEGPPALTLFIYSLYNYEQLLHTKPTYFPHSDISQLPSHYSDQ
jgi:hypothetical protein